MKKKILYIEISTAHTEILRSFIEALTPEYDVELLINEKSLTRVKALSSKIKVSTLKEETYLHDIIKRKNELKPDFILLNSAQGRRIRDLCLRLFFDRTPIVGIHHNAENIYKSFTQKIIHFKIKKYIVLADFIRDFLKTKLDGRVEVESFYPLSYPEVEAAAVSVNFKYVVVPGVLEQDRRDYLGFVDMVKKADAEINPQIKFVLIGNSKNHDGPQIVRAIQRNKLESRFILFDHYVEDEILLAYVQPSFAIMPLMHPGTRWFDKYFETKISGAYSLAFAYGKKLLMHEVFRAKSEFSEYGVFYKGESLAAALLAAQVEPPPQKLDKFQKPFQKEKLLKFISGVVS